jgi:small-conductance mechanosensitive channel
VNTEWSVALEDLASAFEEDLERISDYTSRAYRLFWMHVVWIVFVVWASWMARIWMARPPLSGSRPIPDALSRPIAAGLVLGISASMWIYSEAPPKLGWLLSLFTLPFLYVALRSLLPVSFKAPMIGLVLIVLLDLGRRVLMDLEALAHLLLVVEAIIALAGLIWLRRPGRIAEIPRSQRIAWVRGLGLWLHFALFGAAISLIGSVLGWTALADLLMRALVMGTFIGAILFTAIHVLQAIVEASVYSGKLDGLRIVRNHRENFLVVVGRGARLVALATWFVTLLGNLSIQDSARSAAATLLSAPIGYGSVQLTLGGLAAFGITIWVSWMLARFIATALDEEIFSRVALPRGVPFALSTITRYTILVIGFVVAVAVLGFEVSNLALIVSALGVGIGFGMQNVVNNFISGLILLFERPIKVGDLVSLQGLLGTVDRIGIRSSTIRSFDGADVIVPNGDLISNQVTNWTLSDTRRRVIFPIGVAYGTPARRVIELLEQVASAHPEILAYPAPIGLFRGFGDSSLDFELRAWTESEDALTTVRSDVAVAIQEALAAASIEVPFPQRDVYLKEARKPPAESPS